ncbi:MAG TPA: uroporphyrinogen-III C-methyltransferase [Terriglobia bacterium]|nr:uroporphyrinogen-III C-methyltransferase [Terriglobia bacterium]
MTTSGLVYIVGAGPGDPELITVKGLRCLRESDVILHDRLISTGLLTQARGDAVLVDVGKRFGHEDRQQPEIHKLMIEYAQQGKTVCRLKGGDPFVFGRGGEEADALLAAHIRFEIVPGVSSVTAAAVAAGFPLTHREVNHGFLVITGSRSVDFEAAEWSAARTLLRSGGTVIVFMGLVRIEAIIANLIQNGCSPDLPAAVVSRATWPSEETRAGTLRDIHQKSEGLSSPALLILGNVVALSHEKRNS